MLTPEPQYDRVIVEFTNNQPTAVRIEAREVAKDEAGAVQFERPLPTILDDVTGVHAKAALGAVAGGLAVELEAVKTERDRLRVIADTFAKETEPSLAPENPGPGSAAEPSLEP